MAPTNLTLSRNEPEEGEEFEFSCASTGGSPVSKYKYGRQGLHLVHEQSQQCILVPKERRQDTDTLLRYILVSLYPAGLC